MTRKPKPSGLPNKRKKQGRRPNDALPLRAYFLIVCEGAPPSRKPAIVTYAPHIAVH